MSFYSWFLVIFWGGPTIVGVLFLLGTQFRRAPQRTFEGQRAEAARWMQTNGRGLEHWWDPSVLTVSNPNPSPGLPYEVAYYIFMDLTQRGLLFAKVIPVEVSVGETKFEVATGPTTSFEITLPAQTQRVPMQMFFINPGRKEEWQEIINITPLQVFWRKHRMAILWSVFSAVLGFLLCALVGPKPTFVSPGAK